MSSKSSEILELDLLNYATQVEDDDFRVEYSIESFYVPSANTVDNEIKSEIDAAISDINSQQDIINSRIEGLNSEIDRLTNHADRFDYTLAVSSGIICGLIDSFFVGEFDFELLKKESHKKINKFIEQYARKNGYTGNGRLKEAITYLEDKFKVSNDNAFTIDSRLRKDAKGNVLKVSSAKLHHIEDIAHHPTPFGLAASIICEIFGTVFFFTKDGHWETVKVDVDPQKRNKIIFKLIAISIVMGIIGWLIYMANKKMKEEELKVSKPLRRLVLLVASSPAIIALFVSIKNSNWRGHLISDVGGSNSSKKDGMGVPGFSLSILYLFSSIKGIRETGLPKIIGDWYSKDKFDLRKEVAVLNFAKKQAMPVLINEVIVRTIYCIRHLVEEKKTKGEWIKIDWNKVKPWGNRTINRMLTISSGTFMATDLIDATARSLIENGVNIYNPKLYVDFVLRINFVGVGRFAIAIYTDAKMGVKKTKAEQERLTMNNKYLMLENSKLFYLQGNVWIAARDTAMALEHLRNTALESVMCFNDKVLSLDKEWEQLGSHISNIVKDDPKFASQLLTLLN